MRRRAFLAGVPPALAACSPTVQLAHRPGADFAGPRLENDRFVSFDGVGLGLTSWEAAGEPWAVIVALHGMNDYAEAFTLAAPIWAEQGITTYAYDQRGFGRSPARGVWGGQRLMMEDLRTAVRLARQRHPDAVLAIVGESMGGAVTISAMASADPPAVDRVVLIAPAVWGFGQMPLVYRSTLWLGAHTIGSNLVKAPRSLVRRRRASDNVEHMRRMGRDRNVIFRTRIDTLYGLTLLMQHAGLSVGRMRRPPAVLYCYGEHDRVIPKKPSFNAAGQLRAGDRSAYYENGWHMLTRDLQGEIVTRDIAAYIRDPGAPLPSGAPPIPVAPKAP
jgi:alpha-beta hydrolase superfamily lysophospholipase